MSAEEHVNQLEHLEPVEAAEYVRKIIFYTLAEGHIKKATDLIVEVFDSLYTEGKFQCADHVFNHITLDGMDTYITVALLSVALVGRDELTSYSSFVDRVEEYYKILCPMRLEELIKGFKT